MEPNQPLACPSCASKEIVKGSLIASDENEIFNGRFYPQGLRFFAISRSVPVTDNQGFHACEKCGCLWNYVEVPKLQSLLQKRVNGESPFASGTSHAAKAFLLAALAVLLVVVVLGAKSLFLG